MGKTFRVGTRKSPLALKQVDEVMAGLKKFYPDVKFDIVAIDTYGDRDKNTPISSIEGSDFFTREIDEALLRGEIDFAVHSAKDLPDRLKNGLVIAALTDPAAPYDALVSRSGLKLRDMRRGAKIGTSSSRRKEGLRNFRSDFGIVDIRGNMEERLEKMERDGLDGIVIAACALIRLGMADRITQRIPFDVLIPHPLQGSLAVVARNGDIDLLRLLKGLERVVAT